MRHGDAKERLLRAAFRRGWSDERIAPLFDVVSSTVRNWRHERGIEPLSGPEHHRTKAHRFTSQQVEEMNDLRFEGWSVERIAQQFGCSRRTVYRRLRPEIKSGLRRKALSEDSRRRLATNMRRIQPAGTAASWVVIREMQELARVRARSKREWEQGRVFGTGGTVKA